MRFCMKEKMKVQKTTNWVVIIQFMLGNKILFSEVLLSRYVIIQKLGWGHFSTVWLSRDFKYDTYVAVKIQKSSPQYMEAALDEVEILQKVAEKVHCKEWNDDLKNYYKDVILLKQKKQIFPLEDTHVLQLLNAFVHKTPYGNHFCMVFEILGVNLLEIIKKYDYKGVFKYKIRFLLTYARKQLNRL